MPYSGKEMISEWRHSNSWAEIKRTPPVENRDEAPASKVADDVEGVQPMTRVVFELACDEGRLAVGARCLKRDKFPDRCDQDRAPWRSALSGGNAALPGNVPSGPPPTTIC